MGKESKKEKKKRKEKEYYEELPDPSRPKFNLDENDYANLDDKIDEKELARLRRQAVRKKVDSEAEDYDEKKEKRKALQKAKEKKMLAE